MEKLWGRRLDNTHPEIAKFNSSINIDYKLAEYDIKGSLAHVQMLGKCGIISKKDANSIQRKLKTLLEKIQQNKIDLEKINVVKFEDIHQFIAKELGKLAWQKLHAARSRNGQIALDLKLYCKDKLLQIKEQIIELQKILLKQAGRNIKVIMPGYTHLQPAQYILLSHSLLAYLEMLERDKKRFDKNLNDTDYMPLGSGVLRGTSYPIDRKFVAEKLDFKNLTTNSIDAVSDRDFIIDMLSAISILSMHLSRIAQDFILYSSYEFGFIEFDDKVCTGSSMMPNKKNPDPLELIRGSTGKTYGNLINLLVVMKGLPTAYNKDLQLDKESLFSSVELAVELLQKMIIIMDNFKVNKGKIQQYIEENEFLYAADICEYLGRIRKISYREAHDIVGEIIKVCVKEKHTTKISDLSQEDLSKISSVLNKNKLVKLFNPLNSVKSIRSFGGTNPAMVKKMILKWKRRLEKNAFFPI